jgi:hypothetical protein
MKSVARARKVLQHYREGKIPLLEKHEVNPGLKKGTRENYLYFTLPCSINYQRSSPATWQAALKTYEDPATRFVFFPELVMQHTIEELRAALTKHKLAIQQNSHTKIWHTICKTLHESFSDDPRQVLKAGNMSIVNTLAIIQDYKKGFPYLSGLKLSNYWLFILSRFTDAMFIDMHELSIIPDTHIIQASEMLGVVPAGATPAQVDQAWRSLLKGTGIPPSELHCAFWNWSRNGFKPAA